MCLSSLCIFLVRPGSAGGVFSPSVYYVYKRDSVCACLCDLSLSLCKCVYLSVCLSMIEGGSKERESAQDLQIA